MEEINSVIEDLIEGGYTEEALCTVLQTGATLTYSSNSEWVITTKEGTVFRSSESLVEVIAQFANIWLP